MINVVGTLLNNANTMNCQRQRLSLKSSPKPYLRGQPFVVVYETIVDIIKDTHSDQITPRGADYVKRRVNEQIPLSASKHEREG